MRFLGRNIRYLFSLFLLLSIPLNAKEIPKVDILMQSPAMQETDPGTIITTSFLITNNTKSEEEFLGRIKLPDQWKTIPSKQTQFKLAGGKQTPQIIAIKIPRNYPSGQYKIEYTVQGLDSPDLLRTQTFYVFVQPIEKVEAYMSPPPRNIVQEEAYVAFLNVSNNGNVPTNISLEGSTYLKSKVEIFPSDFTLKPLESKRVTISVQTGKLPTNKSMYDDLNITVKPLNKTFSERVEVFPPASSQFKPYIYLPSKMAMGYGMNDDKVQAYGQLSGKGYVDEKRERKVEYYALLPAINQFNVYRDLGGKPEKAFLHYSDNTTDFFIGDGIYKLTPLTMLTRFGQGASLLIKPGDFEFGGVYVDDTSNVPRINAGAFASYKPIKEVSLKTTFLHTEFKKDTRNLFNTKENTNTGSFQCIYNPSKKIKISSEVATTFDAPGSVIDRSSFYIRTKVEPAHGFYISLEKIRANSEFIGYYNNWDNTAAALGFPIYKTLRSFYSYSNIKSNLNDIQDRSKTNFYSHSAGLTNTFPSGFYTSLSYNKIFFKNRDYKQDAEFARINFGKSYPRWSIQAVTEFGEQKSTSWTDNHKLWQNYQAYLNLQPDTKLNFSLFGYFGNILLNEFANKRYTLGSSINWKHTSWNTKLVYQQTLFPREQSRAMLNAILSYLSKSKREFKFQTNFYQIQEEKNKFEFLFSYSIPFEIPILRKGSVSSLKGQIHRDEGDNSRLVVTCDNKRMLTDENGVFAFNNLTPGTSNVVVEEPGDYVFYDHFPLEVDLKGGRRSKIDLVTAPPGEISGKIELFDFEKHAWDSGTNKQNIVFVKGIPNTIVQAISSDQKHIFQEMTNEKGEFFFHRLRPGNWTITFINPQIPDQFYLDQRSFDIELSSGENQYIEAKIKPAIRRFKTIDTGEIK